MVTTTLTTAEELANLPDDGHRYDLIRGELYRVPPSEDEHGGVAGEIASHVGAFNLGQRLGKLYVAEAGFFLSRDPDVVVAPDVAYVRTERLRPRTERRGFLPIAPDLAVEVISPSETAKHVADKIAAYLAAGTPLLWVVRSNRQTVTVYEQDRDPRELGIGDVLDGGAVLPGFRLPVAAIFD